MSKADSIVPMRLSKKLIKAFEKEPSTVVYEKDTHADLITEIKPWQDIINFLDKTSSPTLFLIVFLKTLELVYVYVRLPLFYVLSYL